MDPRFLVDQLRRALADETGPDAVVAAFEQEIAALDDELAAALHRCFFANWLYGLGQRDLALLQLARSESLCLVHPHRLRAGTALALVRALQAQCHAWIEPARALRAARGAVETLFVTHLDDAPTAALPETARALLSIAEVDRSVLCIACARHASALLQHRYRDRPTFVEARGWFDLALSSAPGAGEVSVLGVLAVNECAEAFTHLAFCAGEFFADDEVHLAWEEALWESGALERLEASSQAMAAHVEPIAFIHSLLRESDRDLDETTRQRVAAIHERLDPATHALEVGGCALLLGQAERKRGNLDDAAKLLGRAWGALRATVPPGHTWRTEACSQAAHLFAAAGEPEKAATWIVTSIAELTFATGLPLELAGAALLGRLADLWEESNPAASLFLQKLSALGMDQVTLPLREVHWLLEKAFNPGNHAWLLARALVHAGRLAEAHEVLGWGENRVLVRAMTRRGAAEPFATALSLTPLEQLQAERIREVNDGSPDDLDAHVRRTRDAVLAMAGDFAREHSRYAAEAEALGLELQARQMARLPASPGVTAVIRYVVSADRLGVLLTTPSGTVHVEVPVGEEELNQEAFKFLAAAQDLDRDPAWMVIHDHLLPRAILQRLDQERVARLAIGATGALRFVPFAAVHDMKRYLVERFPVVLLPEAEIDLKGRPRWPQSVALLGSSGGHGSGYIPGVHRELNGICRVFKTAGPQTTLLDLRDDRFDRAAVESALGGGYTLVHVASHFYAMPANASESVLCLGDGGEISLGEVEWLAGSLGNVEMVVLSACSTGVPSAAAEASGWVSPPSLFHAHGVRSVASTLWPVSDSSMVRLIRQFYAGMFAPRPLDKARALQQAQQEIMYAGRRRRPAHPFYWAGLKLSGNWMPFRAPRRPRTELAEQLT